MENKSDNFEDKPRIGKNGNRLKVVKKGDPSPNPNGRPKGARSRTTIVREWLETMESIKNPITGQTEKLSQYDIITLALIKKARNGDVQAFKELMDSSFGKIPDKLQAETKNKFESNLTPNEARNIINKQIGRAHV